MQLRIEISEVVDVPGKEPGEFDRTRHEKIYDQYFEGDHEKIAAITAVVNGLADVNIVGAVKVKA